MRGACKKATKIPGCPYDSTMGAGCSPVGGATRILTWLSIWGHHGGRVGPSGRGKPCCHLRGWRIFIHRTRGHHGWLLGVHVRRSTWWHSIRTSLRTFYIKRTVHTLMQ